MPKSHEIARQLLQIADRLYSRPEFEVRDELSVRFFIYEKEKAIAALKAIGDFEKDYSDSYYFKAKVSAGSAKFTIECPRTTVCKAVKKLKEVDDWECEPLFSESEVNE